MTKKLKQKCEKIASEAGAKLTWVKGSGYYKPGTNEIYVARGGSDRAITCVFCHELGHYKNYLSGTYYKYHHLTGRKFMRTFKTKKALVRYALNAELYTDKVGKRLCKQYFPKVKFVGGYKNNKKFYNMLYQKYFGGYYIIILEKFTNKT